jgi:hypothetical protein
VSKSFLDRTVIETLDWGGEVLFLIAGKALHVFLRSRMRISTSTGDGPTP